MESVKELYLLKLVKSAEEDGYSIWNRVDLEKKNAICKRVNSSNKYQSILTNTEYKYYKRILFPKEGVISYTSCSPLTVFITKESIFKSEVMAIELLMDNVEKGLMDTSNLTEILSIINHNEEIMFPLFYYFQILIEKITNDDTKNYLFTVLEDIKNYFCTNIVNDENKEEIRVECLTKLEALNKELEDIIKQKKEKSGKVDRK